MFKDFTSFTMFPAQAWGHTWERQHELVYRLSKEVSRDVYILPPLGLIKYNMFSLKFVNKVLKRLTLTKSEVNKNKVIDNMKFINSLYIHKFDKISTKINYKLLNRKINFSDNNFFWATYINPTIYEFFKKSKFKVIDLAERRQSNENLSKEMKELEKKAVSEADIVFVDNIATLNDYRYLNKNIFYVPQGYDNQSIRLSKDLDGKSIGYIGNLHNCIDYNYLFKLIEVNKNDEFLIVGGILDKQAEKLHKFDNVKMVGEVPKEELFKYLKLMKYGLIPYKINEFTKGVFPTKLFEYLGAGIPVISTPIPEVNQFRNDKFIFVEDEAKKIDYNVDLENIEEFLYGNTWDSRFKEYLKHIQEVME